MVIVIMGDVTSGRDCVGRLLAEYLGWEFAGVESLQGDAVSGIYLTGGDCAPQKKALYGVIESLNYEWRDVILSCAISDRSLHYRHPLVKFVYLKATGTMHESRLSDRPVDIATSEIAMKRDAAPEADERTLTVDRSEGVEQILTTVISELILK